MSGSTLLVSSVLEIYNEIEMVRDLLSLQHSEKMEIKQGPEGNYMPGVTQDLVTCRCVLVSKWFTDVHVLVIYVYMISQEKKF